MPCLVLNLTFMVQEERNLYHFRVLIIGDRQVMCFELYINFIFLLESVIIFHEKRNIT